MNPENPNLASRQAGRLHYPALDGLRGLAILLVVVYHNFGFINVFFFGWLGVDLFFVLSGFLITDILLNTVGKKGYLKNFYIRRALRIFPLYYLCLILFLFVIPRFNPQFDVKYYTDNQVWLWTYLQNWLYIIKPNESTTGLHHLWSLAVEEQFYLVWPFMILIIRKPGYLIVFMVLLLVSFIFLRLWLWNNQITNLSYYNLYTFSRIDGICIGSLVALIRLINLNFLARYTTAIILFFAGCNFLFFFINKNASQTFPFLAIVGYTTFAMIFGLLVNEAVSGKSKIVNSIFNFPILKFLGRISYGLYVYHWPLHVILYPLLFKQISTVSFITRTDVVCSAITLLIAITISWLSHKYFENIFIKLKSRFSE